MDWRASPVRMDSPLDLSMRTSVRRDSSLHLDPNIFSRLQGNGSPGNEALLLNADEQPLAVQPSQDAGFQDLSDR